jgi:hypothetical protein
MGISARVGVWVEATFTTMDHLEVARMGMTLWDTMLGLMGISTKW